MNLNDDPRALQRAQNAETKRKQRANRGSLEIKNNRAQNAETQRKRRANRGSLEEEYNHRCTRWAIPGVQEHESAQRAVVREEPGV
jgi:hypothetical protein